MIKLTLFASNNTIYINPMHIVAFHTIFYDNTQYTTLCTLNSDYGVVESIDEINDKLNPYDNTWD